MSNAQHRCGADQLGLIFAPTIARISDPSSSKIAAFEQTVSGRQKRHSEIVLAIVRAHPGSTYREVWYYQTATPRLEAAEVQKRLQDLARDEPERGIVPLVTRSEEQRKCRVTGRPAQTWTAVQSRENAA